MNQIAHTKICYITFKSLGTQPKNMNFFVRSHVLVQLNEIYRATKITVVGKNYKPGHGDANIGQLVKMTGLQFFGK
jgi:hypothetical protein